jgi:NodT family efflux transporter outer membrane factor (OMF) lipoprotein
MSHFKVLPLIFISAGLAGCAVGPNFKTPAAPTTSRYTAQPLPAKTTSTANVIPGGNAQHFQTGQDIPAQWWTLFRSKELNALIIKGLKNSPTLEAAKASISQAQANLDVAVGTGLFPSISAQAGSTRQRGSNNNIGLDDSNIFNLYNASVNVSYNLDLFGGAYRYREGLYAQIDKAQFEWEAAYLTLATNIVTTAISEASLRAQINATEELIRSQENELVIVEQQFHLGAVSQADVLTQQTQLAQTRATLPPLQKNLGQFRNALAVLTGELPSEAQLPTFHLQALTLPTQLPLSVPSRLVQQRPDVRAAEALLHAASADIGVAIANRLPQISLTGSYGSVTNQSHNLFGSNASVWALAGALTQPIFNGGALLAKQRVAVAAFDQAAAQYKDTVLKAFQNVADALNAIQADARALKTEAEAERVAFAAFSLVQQQYKLGAVSYIARLDAERQYQQARIARIQAEAARYADTAALFQALGGGWWNRGGVR